MAANAIIAIPLSHIQMGEILKSDQELWALFGREEVTWEIHEENLTIRIQFPWSNIKYIYSLDKFNPEIMVLDLKASPSVFLHVNGEWQPYHFAEEGFKKEWIHMVKLVNLEARELFELLRKQIPGAKVSYQQEFPIDFKRVLIPHLFIYEKAYVGIPLNWLKSWGELKASNLLSSNHLNVRMLRMEHKSIHMPGMLGTWKVSLPATHVFLNNYMFESKSEGDLEVDFFIDSQMLCLKILDGQKRVMEFPWSNIESISTLDGFNPRNIMVFELRSALEFTSPSDGVRVLVIRFDPDIPYLKEWSRLWASLPWLAVLCGDAEMLRLQEKIGKIPDDDDTHSEPEPDMNATSDQAFVTFGKHFKADGCDSLAGDTAADLWLSMTDEEKSYYM